MFRQNLLDFKEKVSIMVDTFTDPYRCHLTRHKFNGINTPTELVVFNQNDDTTILQCRLDAIDAMTFCYIDLSAVNPALHNSALKALSIGLHSIGGKFIFLVNPEHIDLIQACLPVALTPQTPNDSRFDNFKKLLYFSASQHPQAKEKFALDAELFKGHAKHFKIITSANHSDKAFLCTHMDELSKLLLEHTSWGIKTEEKYSPLAMQLRVMNPNIAAFALLDKKQNKIIGFGRLHKHNNNYYFGDFVIHSSYRQRGLGKYLLKAILSKPKAHSLITLIAGGDEHAKALYEKLGFTSITDFTTQHGPVTLNKNTVMVCGVLPPGPVLNELVNKCVCPKNAINKLAL